MLLLPGHDRFISRHPDHPLPEKRGKSGSVMQMAHAKGSRCAGADVAGYLGAERQRYQDLLKGTTLAVLGIR